MDLNNLKLIRDALHRFENRRIGKTYAAAEFTKKVQGLLVTFNMQSAKQIKYQFHVDTVSIQNMNSTLGSNKPIIFDQDAFTVVIDEAINLHIQLQAAEEKLNREERVIELLLRVAKEHLLKPSDELQRVIYDYTPR